MKQIDLDLGDVIHKELDHQSLTLEFETTWRKYNQINTKARKKTVTSRRFISLAAVLMVILLGTIGFANHFRKVDKVDYAFKHDNEVIGKWEAVDFVENEEDFDPDSPAYKEGFYLSKMAFVKGGELLISFEEEQLCTGALEWTKGIVINKQDRTASKYNIKQIKDQTYMFYEWKNGDYILKNMKPGVYVLRQVDHADYSNVSVTRREDKVDYPFMHNPDMIGEWECVDFVENIEDFNFNQKVWMDELFLKSLSIEENGKVSATTKTTTIKLQWSQDLIIDSHEKTSSNCIIKEINGHTYMFYEWKSGDYIFRGRKPSYYVLKKII